ncbi:MAG: ATP-binding cassette domain-containing protein [Burkholderiaceae bacterium]
MAAHDRKWGRTAALIAALAVSYVLLAAFVDNAYYQLILTTIAIWSTVAVAWNIFSGYSGLISFGHAAFFGLGAFTVTLLMVKADISPWIGLLCAPLAGAAAAVVIGIPTFRLRGHYFALAMLAYPLALLYVFEWLGYQELTLPLKRDDALAYMQFANPYAYTVIATVVLALTLAVALAIERSRFGLILQTIKQNEPAAQTAGINPFLWKLAALVISAALTALAGGLYVVVLLVTTPREVFGMLTSASPLVFTMFGGIGSLWGPVIGAAALVPVAEVLHAELGSALPGIQGVVYGAAILLVMLWMPQGIYWRWRDRRGQRQASASRPQAPSKPALVVQPSWKPATPAVRAAASLSVRDIVCRFGRLTVLDHVSFDVTPGSITGIVGPNGAGKTSLFNVINGLVSASHGRIVLDGRDIGDLPTHARCRAGLARTFQVPRIFDRLTVFENVLAGAIPVVSSSRQAHTAALWALECTGLGDYADQLAGTLPAMPIRMMEIARAIAAGPRVLLLDETLAGLSSAEVDSIVAVVQRIRKQGTDIVIIEHTMSAMVPLVDRMIVLNRGGIIADGIPSRIVADDEVIEAYLGSKWKNRAAA